jgi:hypothetical protein
MTDFEWHGYGLLDLKTNSYATLHIGYLPSRKSPALYLTTDGTLKVLAYFRNDEAARIGLGWLDRLIDSVTPGRDT